MSSKSNRALFYVCLICSSNFNNKSLQSAQVIFCSAFQTSLLQGHLNRNLRYVATLNKEHLSSFTINTVQVYGQEKYLLVSALNWENQFWKFDFLNESHHLFTFVLLLQLHEVDVAVSDMLNPTEMNCDVACLVYDVTNPRTFEFCARMYLVNRDFGIMFYFKVFV